MEKNVVNNEKKSKNKLWIIIALMICIAAVIILLLFRIGDKDTVGGDELSANADEVEVVLIEERSMLLKTGESKQIAIADGKEVTFESDDTAVATVDEKGVVTAVAKGCALITVSDGENTS